MACEPEARQTKLIHSPFCLLRLTQRTTAADLFAFASWSWRVPVVALSGCSDRQRTSSTHILSSTLFHVLSASQLSFIVSISSAKKLTSLCWIVLSIAVFFSAILLFLVYNIVQNVSHVRPGPNNAR